MVKNSQLQFEALKGQVCARAKANQRIPNIFQRFPSYNLDPACETSFLIFFSPDHTIL